MKILHFKRSILSHIRQYTEESPITNYLYVQNCYILVLYLFVLYHTLYTIQIITILIH